MTREEKQKAIYVLKNSAPVRPLKKMEEYNDRIQVIKQVIDWLEQEPTNKNDLGVREFEEIVVKYPPEELCTYPEYKGKPYFGIQYRENGESIVGYGTYNSQVLSRYLKDYFMSTTKNDYETCIHNKGILECDMYGCKYEPIPKNDLGVDCISREQALKELKESAEHHANNSREEALLRRDRDIIRALPPSNTTRAKMDSC